MSKFKKIPLSIPVLKGNELKYAKKCIDTAWVSSTGKYVNEFEEKIAAYTGSHYAVACVNGTAALHISLLLSNVGLGDEVIVPTITFIAPVNAIAYTGARPVFMDCNEWLNIDVPKVKEFIEQRCFRKNGILINNKTKARVKAIIPVHVFGNPVDMAGLKSIAQKAGLAVIEDATESLGSYFIRGRLKGKKTGIVGDLGCLSFNGNKIITTGGGGMILTNDKKVAQRARYLTTQAKDDEKRSIHNSVGYNYRLTNVSAAIGVAQMEQLENHIRIKRRNYDLYKKHLKSIPGVTLMGEPAHSFSNRWFYTILVDQKVYGRSNLELMEYLEKLGIETRPLWYPNHAQKYYLKDQVYKIEKAWNYHSKVLNLPCSIDLTEVGIRRVCMEIRKYAKK